MIAAPKKAQLFLAEIRGFLFRSANRKKSSFTLVIA